MSAAPDLAQQLAAHPRWEWREGMLLRPPSPAEGAHFDGRLSVPWRVSADGLRLGRPAVLAREGWTIDLSDWPTVGALLGMLAEARRNGALYWEEWRGEILWSVDAEPPKETPGEAPALRLLAAWGLA